MKSKNSDESKPLTKGPPNLFRQVTLPPRPHWHLISSLASKERQRIRATSGVNHFSSTAKGIRYESAPPVPLTSSITISTLGLPECARRAALDTNLDHTEGYLPSENLLSPRIAQITEGEDECSASSENEQLDNDLESISVPKTLNQSPIMSLEEATCLCRMVHDESLYRRHHSLTESSSDSEEVSEEDSESDWDSQIVTMSAFDTPQSVPEYANVRWTLARRPSSPTSNVDPSLIVQKYGLSGSMLLAKQRSYLADPEPSRLDSCNFRATKNQERTVEVVLCDCTEQIEYLSNTNPICLPFVNVVSSTASRIDFSESFELVKAASSRISTTKLYIAHHNDPQEPLLSSPTMAPPSTAFSIVNRCDYGICYGDISSETQPSNIVNKKSVVISGTGPSYANPRLSLTRETEGVILQTRLNETLDSKSLNVRNGILEGSLCSQGDFGAYSTRALSTSTSDNEMKSPLRPIVVPPEELSVQLKEHIDQAVHRKDVSLYLLTSNLGSDGNKRLVDPQSTLEDEEDITDSSISDKVRPPISDSHVKQIAKLNTYLSQLEKEMQELEMKGVEINRALRELESTSGLQEADLWPHILSTGGPDLSLSAKDSSKRDIKSRWRWTKPKVHRRSKGSRNLLLSTPKQEMVESSEQSQLFKELLGVISKRSKLVTQEAVIMAELKKIGLETHEEFLQKTFNNLQHPSYEDSRDQLQATASGNHGTAQVLREHRIKLLNDEMSRISKEKIALTTVQDETMQRSNLQELSVHEVLNRYKLHS